jgi:pimeloyl-ACP methyl ester carboxylesterase
VKIVCVCVCVCLFSLHNSSTASLREMSAVHNETPFHSVEYNKGTGLPTIVFFSGFPDNETSSWGSILPETLKKTHHIVFICLPGYHKGAVLRPWGYTREELMDMLHKTVQEVVPGDEKFDFVTHDWGAHFGVLYENAHPERIKTLTLVDVGLFTPLTIPLYHLLVIFCYQSWFALSFLVSQFLGTTAGLLFLGFFFLPIFNALRPTNEKVYVPVKSITPEKCYVYYYTMKKMLTGSLETARFPSCPTFYMVSAKNKSVFNIE